MATSTTSISNPYKFRVSRNAAANIGNGAFLKITYDTEQYDTNSNFSGGTYTVPVSGYYQFNWSLSATMSSGADELLTTAIFKNGVEYSRGSTINYRNAEGVSGSDIIQLAAGNTVEIQAFGTVGRAIGVGASTCYFSGYLVSQT